MILALLLSASAAAATPESLGRDLAAAARRGGATAVAVEPFDSPRGAPAGFGRDAADAVLRGIVDSRRVRAVERERLPAVMSERRLAASGATAAAPLPRLGAGDAVVVGTLARAAAGWSLTARVVSVASGEVLGAGRAELSDAEYGAPAADPVPEQFPPLDTMIESAHGLAAAEDAPALAARVADGSAPAPARATAVLALVEKDGSEDFALADALHDADAVVRFSATMAFGRAPASWAEGPLRRLLREDASWLVRFGAAQALVRYPSDAAGRDLSAARREDPSWRVRQQAGDSLAARGMRAP